MASSWWPGSPRAGAPARPRPARRSGPSRRSRPASPGCNGTSAQSWTVGTDGTIRVLGKCLDVLAMRRAGGTHARSGHRSSTGEHSRSRH
ncbi:hypothetical protein FCI23_23405 [Actinacidiphila oryziradicis]|uniref:Uncharacterized protein n=1 Tax=Actinacidiphila oryziradicis TaxID=2571141 RepID=A0A4U0SIC0_9ACTN|nr:hypothetical protein FCI23_23405 [Actinacidiphila oryziradicis]